MLATLYARLLGNVRRGGKPVAGAGLGIADAAQAYAVQDALIAQFGGAAAWKVGAPNAQAEPGCAPLPRDALRGSGATLRGPEWRLRGIEVEIALRLRADLVADAPPSREAMLAAVDCVLPAIEVVESRLLNWRESPPLVQMADLQSNGALVLGEPSAVAPAGVDLRQLTAYLAFDGQPVASARGAHPVGDFWPLLAWLAVHCTRRGMPLRAGQVVTTGSCTGLLFAPEGAKVEAELQGIGRVSLQF